MGFLGDLGLLLLMVVSLLRLLVILLKNLDYQMDRYYSPSAQVRNLAAGINPVL